MYNVTIHYLKVDYPKCNLTQIYVNILDKLHLVIKILLHFVHFLQSSNEFGIEARSFLDKKQGQKEPVNFTKAKRHTRQLLYN